MPCLSNCLSIFTQHVTAALGEPYACLSATTYVGNAPLDALQPHNRKYNEKYEKRGTRYRC